MEIKLSNKHLDILDYLFTYPRKEIHVRELAREINMSHTWVNKIVHDLDEFIHIKKGILTTIKAKSESKLFIKYKRIHNLWKIVNTGLVEFLTEEYMYPKAIILFGSYSLGEDNEQSDIDIAVITNMKKDLNLKKYESAFGRKISIQEISSPEHNFQSTLANGIVLFGYLELK
jgi:predicted nucleotidyltransferase